MVEALAGARKTVRFENFIFAGITTGRSFAKALSGAAKRGVDVKVLYDPIGTMMVKGGSIADVLRRDGVTTRPFQPLSPFAPWSWLRLRHRDHRKTLTIDGVVAFVGGLCISDNWSPSEKGGRGWRDTALRVRGSIAGDVERAFDAMWESSNAGPSPQLPCQTADSSPAVAILAEDLPGAHAWRRSTNGWRRPHRRLSRSPTHTWSRLRASSRPSTAPLGGKSPCASSSRPQQPSRRRRRRALDL